MYRHTHRPRKRKIAPKQPLLLSLVVRLITPPYPISTLPEHLHSTSLSHTKTTLKHTKQKETLSFPLYRSLPVSRSPTPIHSPSLGDPATPTHTSHSLFWRLRSRCASRSLPTLSRLLQLNKATGVSFHLTLLTFRGYIFV